MPLDQEQTRAIVLAISRGDFERAALEVVPPSIARGDFTPVVEALELAYKAGQRVRDEQQREASVSHKPSAT